MKRTLLVVVAVVSAMTSLASSAGRTGDQLMLQERDSQRVIQEKQRMHAMMKECSEIMSKSK